MAPNAVPAAAPDGGLIGEIATQGNQDFELRQTPDGWVLPFRVKAGRQSQLVQAHDAIAQALAAFGKVGDRVTVFGHTTDETFRKGDRDIDYTVLHVERIVGPDYALPVEEAESVPVWEPEELGV